MQCVDETNLSIQNYASLLVNPKVLFHQLAILLREETICEADETVWGRHSLVDETGRTLDLLSYILRYHRPLGHVGAPEIFPGGKYTPDSIPSPPPPSRLLRCGRGQEERLAA